MRTNGYYPGLECLHAFLSLLRFYFHPRRNKLRPNPHTQNMTGYVSVFFNNFKFLHIHGASAKLPHNKQKNAKEKEDKHTHTHILVDKERVQRHKPQSKRDETSTTIWVRPRCEEHGPTDRMDGAKQENQGKKKKTFNAIIEKGRCIFTDHTYYVHTRECERARDYSLLLPQNPSPYKSSYIFLCIHFSDCMIADFGRAVYAWLCVLVL